MINCVGVSKIYTSKRGDITALEEISFCVKRAEFLCILGPSGCGKSTLLSIIGGLTGPTKGLVHFDMEAISDGYSVKTAIVFQDQSLFPWMTVVENVAIGLMAQGWSRSARREQALKILAEFGLDGFGDRKIAELSGGMQQRATLARAFLTNPQVLLMDEPFQGLDALTKLILQQELLSTWMLNRRTVIFVTHDIDEAIMLGDRILVMSRRPAKIKAELNIDLSRPRTLDMLETRDIAKLKWEIRQMLQEEVNIALKK